MLNAVSTAAVASRDSCPASSPRRRNSAAASLPVDYFVSDLSFDICGSVVGSVDFASILVVNSAVNGSHALIHGGCRPFAGRPVVALLS